MDEEQKQLYIDKLTSVFNKGGSEFSVKYVEYEDGGKQMKEFHVFLNGQLCCKLNIQDGNVFIEKVNKCSPAGFAGSGTYNIERLIEFSKMEQLLLKIPYDVAVKEMHKVHVPLSKLYILSGGKSWYNTMGFYEEHYASNKRITDEFITNPTMSQRAENLDKFVKYIQKPMMTNTPPSPSPDHSLLPGKTQKSKSKSVKSSTPRKNPSIKFSIKQVFTYVLSRLNDKTHPPRKSELEYYREYILKHYVKLDKLLNSKTWDLTYMDTEPTE